ncbi:MAG TPA: ATP-binding protein [Pyrinomonadaceae bacterium]|nr:ATP-binding protein [Pyrinomonadaceae bacterium]
MDEQLLREFLAEADERVEALFADVERLRRVSASDGRARRELVARIFRHVHTLKGSASTLHELAELAALGRLAHEFENLLDAARQGRAPLTDAAIDVCEDATQALSLLLEQAARGDGAAFETPIAVVEQLRRHAGATAGAHASDANEVDNPQGAQDASADRLAPVQRGAEDELPEEIARGLSAVERQHLSESVSEGASVIVVAAAFDLATLDEHFSRLTSALGECGEIISTFPGDPGAADQISFHILYAANCTRAELEARLAPHGARIIWASVESEPRADAAPGVSGEREFASPAAEHAGDPSASVHVRVPLLELDELVTATHELFNDTLAMLEQASAPHATATRASGVSPEDEAREGQVSSSSPEAERARRLREDFGALEERVMRLRMQPLMPVLERAARAARIAARIAGKEIDLEIVGGEVRVDRSLAEQIAEPLLHLLRNAIDHGIETAEERRVGGKSPRGRVRLEVAAEGSRVRVRVADDGRGIDTEQVGRVAVAQGLVAAGTRVSEEHALRLIFRPGFSTAARVSDVSGRGVGLDVVEHSLERAGGELRVRTVRGAGTTFELRVPLTLALVPVVQVRAAGGHAYAFDASHIVNTVELEPAEIESDDAGRYRVQIDGERLPLLWLRSLLGSTVVRPGEADARVPAIVVRREQDEANNWQGTERATDHLVVAVEQIEGEREALVRSLGRYATRWRGVGGAFEQRDGTVGLLLDLPKLLKQRGER